MEIANWVLPHVVDRPLMLLRCPDGRHKDCFYQKHITDAIPDAVDAVKISEKNTTREYICIRDLRGLITMVQLAALEIHPWGSRADRIDRPDRITFDLDPDSKSQWDDVLEGAHILRDRLDECGLESFVKTTGGKGLHVSAPIERRTSWDEVKAFAKGVATRMAKDEPKRFLATSSKEKRTGKVYVDYLRNARGATAVAAYTLRARKGAPASTPVRWDEVNSKLQPDAYTMENLPARLSKLKEDPWTGFFDVKQRLTKSTVSKMV